MRSFEWNAERNEPITEMEKTVKQLTLYDVGLKTVVYSGQKFFDGKRRIDYVHMYNYAVIRKWMYLTYAPTLKLRSRVQSQIYSYQ